MVSPLKSLIRDQITELRKHNIMAYGILEGMEKEEIDGMFFSVFICFCLFCLVFLLGVGGAFWFVFIFLVLFVSVFQATPNCFVVSVAIARDSSAVRRPFLQFAGN